MRAGELRMTKKVANGTEDITFSTGLRYHPETKSFSKEYIVWTHKHYGMEYKCESSRFNTESEANSYYKKLLRNGYTPYRVTEEEARASEAFTKAYFD